MLMGFCRLRLVQAIHDATLGAMCRRALADPGPTAASNGAMGVFTNRDIIGGSCQTPFTIDFSRIFALVALAIKAAVEQLKCPPGSTGVHSCSD
jgi:hypothetical protein